MKAWWLQMHISTDSRQAFDISIELCFLFNHWSAFGDNLSPKEYNVLSQMLNAVHDQL